ncbi:MAG: tyrosine--tRNA ligase [Flavobacteriales bacterium]|jgi:tyrosyl-tRNA synthetase|uniref:tyrosine--tRNA ligase n=1 Tax=Blattabacterium sp. (Mastotermes darwiniensis) TaxID=39768 RepID=UPI000231DF06|nr:tyrosine--tRNA ligase [Blattabacterium sp. (Mastotermes darwiniensis)]AER40826.1 putative tyrosyl-tRNA synthetase 1 [Blattabacterium sp. (Mastotermes darwiniensis) str. MADAR]MDR1804673.1 tyrosine--tRNA ligase [Flavobacteriales bacterium]
MKNIIDELSWRGLIQNKVPGVEKQLKKCTTLYIGFDPTSDSLHLGSLLSIIVLIHFQKMGHKSLILIGGATGLIGDPSYKYDRRSFFSKETLYKNIESIKKQLCKLLHFHSEEVEFLDNFNWMKNIYILDFLRDIGKHLTVSYMITKDSVKKRIKNNGISFTEFTYSLIQGYDFLYLNKEKNCLLQIGGSDQWGNITTGIELIRKITGKKAYGITFPLVTRNNGIKFGKSEEGENIWLDHNKTSPYKFYQFLMNISDMEIEKFIRIYTFLPKEKIDTLISKHRKNPEKRFLQKKVASEITQWVHGKESYEKIVKISNILFEKEYTYLLSLDEKIFISIYENLPHMILSHQEFEKGILLLDLLKKSSFFNSKSEAKRALNFNSIFINKKLIKENILLKKENIIGKKYILLQFGKKNFFMIKIESNEKKHIHS